jgi:FkbM family methyltransferase
MPVLLPIQEVTVVDQKQKKVETSHTKEPPTHPIVRAKKVKADATGKMSFQDKEIYQPRRIESWTPSFTSACTSSPQIEETNLRKIIYLNGNCVSEHVGPKTDDCPKVEYAPDSSFVVCRAKGALGAGDLMKVGGSERRIADTFAEIIRVDGGWKKRPHVVDVGMNEGFFSLLSASMGANVLAFDMNPVCFAAMDRAIELNSFENSVELRNVGLIAGNSNTKSDKTMSIQSESCDPAGKLSSTECSWCPKRTDVPVAPLDTVLLRANDANNGGSEDVFLQYSLLKIDAEGSEIGAS